MDDDNSDNEVYDNTDELDKEAAAVAMNEVDDDAQRVVMASDVDEDELEAPEEETEGDFVAVARQMTADIDKNGFNLLGLYNLWLKGSDQLAKDDIKKKRVNGSRFDQAEARTRRLKPRLHARAMPAPASGRGAGTIWRS